MPSRVAMSILAALGVKDQTTCYTYTEYAIAAKKYAMGGLSDLSPVDQAKYH